MSVHSRMISILCVLSFSMRLLETGKTVTQREIYYAFVKHFANQVRPKHVHYLGIHRAVEDRSN